MGKYEKQGKRCYNFNGGITPPRIQIWDRHYGDIFMIANNFVKKNSDIKSEIVNIDISRIFIKKVFVNKNDKESKSIILQVSQDKGVFIDTKFVKTDNYTLNANIGIVLDYEYSLISLINRNQQSEKITGKKLIDLINIFSSELEN